MRVFAAFSAGSIVSLCLAWPAHAQDHRVSATGSASASVVKPLQAVSIKDLSFGAILVGTEQSGEVVVTPNNASAVYIGSVSQSFSCTADCQPHAAVFAVSGEAQRSYRIALPDIVYASGSRTGVQLQVDAFSVVSVNDASSSFGGTLDANGRDRFGIGGSLRVPQGTQADIFRADLPITVSYD